MSGVAVIRYLLTQNIALLAVVPAARIKSGDLPLKTILPAIGVKQVSSIPRNIVSMSPANVQHTDRVQVTVLVKDSDGEPSGAGYPGLRSLLRLVLAACPNTHGTVDGFSVDSILPDIEGPDLPDMEVSILSGSRDFIVRWNAA